jgi:hypothetical protein
VLGKSLKQVEERIQTLRNYSLLHMEKLADGTELFSVPAFLSTHIEQTLHNSSKRLLYRQLIQYYNT